MPTLELPLLELDAQKISQLNPRNVESLFGLWTVFNKCSGSIEGGKRYENMSWRLWNRETFCCPPQPQLAITPAIGAPPSLKDVPELSSSVDSVTSNAPRSLGGAGGSKPQNIPQHPPSQPDSALSRSRGKEKHLTALGLEKMVVSIHARKELEPLSPRFDPSRSKTADATPRPSSPQLRPSVEDDAPADHMKSSTDSGFSTATASTAGTTHQSDHRGSDTSVSSDGILPRASDGLIRSGSVVHGFSPSPIPTSFRAKSRMGHALPAPPPKSLAKNLAPKKNNMFTLGGSSGEDESSFEDRIPFRPQRSSLSESLNRGMQKQKKASFADIVNARKQEMKEGSSQDDEDAIETDDEEDAEDVTTDSAIEEDEEDGDWEDDDEDSKPLAEDKSLFKRVDSRPDLVSRRSMLTMQLHNSNSAAALANMPPRSTPALRRSRPTSPSAPSVPTASDDHDDDQGLTLRVPTASNPRPIISTTSNTYGLAQSPRTTRRNMLATELTESLRKNLLWERRQKSSTANAVFKRRHTAQNMANLQEYPGEEALDTSKNNSWNHIFDAPWEYHTKGW